jgi:hypothetical protein
MALEVLYGPSDVTVDGIAVAGTGGFMWLQGIGLLAVLHPTGGAFGFYAVQMDGSAQSRSSFNGVGFGPLLDLRSVRGLAVKAGDGLHNFNWLVGQPDTAPFFTPSVGGHDINVIAADRYLQFSSLPSGFHSAQVEP